MNLPWLRLYTEFAADPKIQILAFEDQRHYVMLLCLKGNGTLDASTPNETYRDRLVAKGLGLDPINSADAKQRLMDGGLIDERWNPIRWDSRQFQSDYSTLRVQKHREKLKGNVSETLLKRRETVIDQSQNRTDTDREQNRLRGDARGEPRATRSAATRLPKDFDLTEDRKAYATAQGIDPAATFENFRDYWTAASGAKARKHDWDACWRMWCRNQLERKTQANTPKKTRYAQLTEKLEASING